MRQPILLVRGRSLYQIGPALAECEGYTGYVDGLTVATGSSPAIVLSLMLARLRQPCPSPSGAAADR